MTMPLPEIHPVILCGGAGTRLWPLSRQSFPKQFVPLVGERSLMELTVARAMAIDSQVRVVASESHRFLVLEHSDAAGADVAQVLLEPEPRNTAAAMALAALDAEADDLLLFLPADHYLPDTDQFAARIRSGAALAADGWIVTLGIRPDGPATGYGYLRLGRPLGGANDAAEVAAFIEKPDAEMAASMVAAGDHLWNAGIFLLRAETLLEALSEHAPEILGACQDAMAAPERDGRFLRPEPTAFNACPSTSIDYAVMEKARQVAVLPFDGEWSDVGSWETVARLRSADEEGNRIDGSGWVLRGRNVYLRAPHRPVVALGVSDLVVVDTPDALLVADRRCVEKVKEVVATLEEDGVAQAHRHRSDARPWGSFDVIDCGERFQVKHITVKPGARLSLQSHHHRAEHWIVVRGTARVRRGDEVFLLAENQSTHIPLGAVHSLENPGKVTLEIIEVQSGTYLGEDDIVRYDDKYGRANGAGGTRTRAVGDHGLGEHTRDAWLDLYSEIASRDATVQSEHPLAGSRPGAEGPVVLSATAQSDSV